ncbi:MAG: hypothetical protein ABW051_10065 [Burkholderiaceae bacterium]
MSAAASQDWRVTTVSLNAHKPSPAPHPSPRDPRLDQVRAYVAEGTPVRHIALLMGLTEHSVRLLLRQVFEELRDAGGRPQRPSAS